MSLDAATAVKNLQSNFSLPPGRASIFSGINGSTIIDSSYNSSPDATSEFLKSLSLEKSKKIAILGDMRELGQQSEIEHTNLGQLALKSADEIITVGPLTTKYFPAHKKIHKFLYWWQAQKFLENNPLLLKNTTVLVKGSQNTIYLEELVKYLLATPTDARSLCRQSSDWLQLKNTFRLSHEEQT